MNDRPVKFGRDAKSVETNGPVLGRDGHTRWQGPQSETYVSFRTASPSDGKKLRAMFSRSTSETVYRRFHVPYPEVPGWMLSLMLGAGQQDMEALVAVAEGEIVGHAMYARVEASSEAEMAIIIEDGWQSRGVGRQLLSELAQRAKYRGIETFTGEVLGENRPMLGLAAIFQGTDYETEDGVCHVRMPLPAPTASASQTNHRAA